MITNDSEWLGEQAAAGPSIRVGLGILLAQGDWTWWHHPGAISTIMLDAVSASGIAEWGGDPAVLDAWEWLDLNIALEIAQAFQVVLARRGGDLRLKIQRSVYSWDSALRIHAICDDLARAFARERIFIDWPSDRRPRRPAASTTQGVSVTSSKSLAETSNALIKSLPTASWSEPAHSATIAVVTLDDLLKQQFSSELLIILDTEREAVVPHMDTIRIVTGAQCAIFLPANQPNIDRWLKVFGTEIAALATIDVALSAANREVERHGFFLASTQTFILRSNRTLFPPATQKAERIETVSSPTLTSPTLAKSKAGRSQPLPNLEIEGVKMEAAPPVIRVMDAHVEHEGQPIKTFPERGTIQIQLRIQPVSPLKRGVPAFPDQNLDWQDDQKVLQVHLLEVGSEPKSTSLLLPRSGASTPAIFSYVIPIDSAIDMRFVVSKDTCILQTARLQGHAGGPIEFLVEAFNSPVDQHRTGFDLALLVNSSLGNAPSATILTSEGIHLTELEYVGIVTAREELRATLESCLAPHEPFSTSLFSLANKGRLLLEGLRDSVSDWPTTMNRVQLTTPSNEHFPIEYLYDGEIPDNEDAALCDNRARETLI